MTSTMSGISMPGTPAEEVSSALCDIGLARIDIFCDSRMMTKI